MIQQRLLCCSKTIGRSYYGNSYYTDRALSDIGRTLSSAAYGNGRSSSYGRTPCDSPRALSSNVYGNGRSSSYDRTPCDSRRALSSNVYGNESSSLHRALSEIKRGWIAHDENANGEVKASHPNLEFLAEMMRQDERDWLSHEGMYFELGRRTNVVLGAFVWNTSRGQACGGIRMRSYEKTEDYVRDGLRLAIGMGRKSALAGLWAGGGKGVIAIDPKHPVKDSETRKNVMLDYGDFLSSLRGCYVAAEDAGLFVEDCDNVFSRTRFMTCISPTFGGSGNPSVPTAIGVATAIESAIDFRSQGKETVQGKTFAIQGAGNVSRPLMNRLFELGAKSIICTDVDEDVLSRAENEVIPPLSSSLDLRLVEHGDLSILSENVNVLSPCAYGGIITEETTAKMQCDIVCGAANNQLLDPVRGDLAMTLRGITYVPDFVANRMGIVNCADEAFGRVGTLGDHNADPAVSRHLVGKEGDWENSVWNITAHVLQLAEERNITPGQAANELADEMANRLHPIWPNRSRDIQVSVREQWLRSYDL